MGEGADPASFGRILRGYRTAAGLTQEELARQAGLSVRALSDMERGTTSRPYPRSVRMIADALELDEPARTRLMSALHDDTEPDDVAGAEAGPAGAVRLDTRARPDRIRRARWARWSAVGVAAVLAGGVLWWTQLGHDPVVTDGVYPAVAQCDDGAQLASSAVRAKDGTYWGTVELRYSSRCAAVWARFDPSPAFASASAATVTLKITRRPGGKSEVSTVVDPQHKPRTRILLLHGGCGQGSALITELGRDLASASTSCKALP